MKNLLLSPLPLTLGALLAGCGSNCDTPWYEDRDGDNYGARDSYQLSCDPPKGFVRDARDCDDRAAAIHPGVADTCNGVDDDCDGTIDPESSTFFADLDGDGVGAADNTIEACSPPDGFVALAGDCDDTDDRAFPGAQVELCDGIDNDCDTLIDEAIEGDTYYYPDNDEDGFGQTSLGQRLCAPPPGWVQLSGDCDDANSSRYPGAIERCNGLDDDCDNETDLLDPGGVVGLVVAYGDGDGDGYGAGPATLVCTVSSGLSADNLDCDDDDPDIHPSASEICDPLDADEDCDTFADDDDASTLPASLSSFFLDEDGDGLGDIDAPISLCDATFGVSSDSLDCDDDDSLIGEDYWRLDDDGDGYGGSTIERGGSCSAPGPDYHNVASPFDCNDVSTAIHPGALDRCGDEIDSDCSGLDPACGSTSDLAEIADISRSWASDSAISSELSVVSRPMDIDGDGLNDLWLGAPGASEVWQMQGPAPEIGQWEPVEIIGGPLADRWGSAIEPIADVTGDSQPDVIVGADGAGIVGVLQSPSWGIYSSWLGSGIGGTIAVIDGPSPRLAVGEPDLSRVAVVDPSLPGIRSTSSAYEALYTLVDSLGSSLVCCVDAEDDGVPELVIGAPEYGADSGRIYLAPTDISGSWTMDTVYTSRYDGDAGSGLGALIAAGHDVDGDGRTDLAATTPAGAGAGYVLSPTAQGTVDDATILSVDGFTGLGLGESVALADIDGDGAGDLLLGTTKADVSGADGGAVYLFFGPRSGSYEALDADRIWYGEAGALIGAGLAAGPYDVDDGDDVWVRSAAGSGSLWLVPGR